MSGIIQSKNVYHYWISMIDILNWVMLIQAWVYFLKQEWRKNALSNILERAVPLWQTVTVLFPSCPPRCSPSLLPLPPSRRLSDSPGGGVKRDGLPPSLSRPAGQRSSSQPTPEVDPQTILKALFKSPSSQSSPTSSGAAANSQATAFRIKI